MKRLLPLLLATACATAPQTFSGAFGDIRMSPETGDLGGFEMELRADGPAPTVVFTRCEGGCYGGKTWPVAVSGDTIAFTVVDDWYDQDGHLSQQDTRHYGARFSGGAWILTSPEEPQLKARLRRVRGALPGHTEGLAHY